MLTRNCRSVIYKDTPAQRKWVLVDNTWIAIEHPSKSQAFSLLIHAGNVLQKFGFEIQSQTEVKSPETKKSIMATRLPCWKWHIWKSIGFFPYTLVICYWSLDLIFKAKQKLESGNRKIQDGRQAAILKVTSLKNSIGFCPWPPTTCIWNFKLKFQSKLELLSRNHIAYRRTDRQTHKVIPVYPPPTSLGGGITIYQHWFSNNWLPIRQCTSQKPVTDMARNLRGSSSWVQRFNSLTNTCQTFCATL